MSGKKPNYCPAEIILAFLIGLGLQPLVLRFALWLRSATFMDFLMNATSLGIVGYVFWQGLKELGELYWLEKQGAKVYGTALVEPVFYWLVGAAMAAILF